MKRKTKQWLPWVRERKRRVGVTSERKFFVVLYLDLVVRGKERKGTTILGVPIYKRNKTRVSVVGP